MPLTRSAILSIHCSLKSESFGGGRPLLRNVAHAKLPSCKPGPMQATTHSCPESGGEQGSPRSPIQRHSSGLDGCLDQVGHQGTFSAGELDSRFLGTPEAPTHILPGPAKSRATPKRLRNGVPNMMS